MENNQYHGHIVEKVLHGSIAWELGIERDDCITRINGHKIKDVLDYHYFIHDEEITISVRKPDGTEWEADISKEYEADIGLTFREGLMDSYRACRNRCIFCFIDQMPVGLRETLYFKDDDARLSFLQGNYITLTNLSQEEVDRICLYKLSPMNISIHAADKELRKKMLNNRHAGEVLSYLEQFYAAGITMHSQIVLCKGYNDNEHLVDTIQYLSRYLPYMESVSVVPVGLTKYREGLAKLTAFQKEDAIAVIRLVEDLQECLLAEHQTRFVHLSDEWYIKAGAAFPPAIQYEGYPQIENGVGMVRSLLDEFDVYFDALQGSGITVNASAATGVLFAPVLSMLSEKIIHKFPNVHLDIYTITNHFFGEEITTAGLLTGQDIISQLKGRELHGMLLLPRALLRAEGDLLLDGISIADMEKALQTRIHIVQSDGISLLKILIPEPLA